MALAMDLTNGFCDEEDALTHVMRALLAVGIAFGYGYNTSTASSAVDTVAYSTKFGGNVKGPLMLLLTVPAATTVLGMLFSVRSS